MKLESRLNWEEYISKLRAKAKRELNTIRLIAGDKDGLWLIKKLDSIHRECIKIYTCAFKTSPVEANNSLLELERNEQVLSFLYKLKSNTSYIDTKHTGQQ